MVENNVAIIVGSMPAVASFMRVYVSESTIYKTVRSKIRRTNGDHSGKGSKPSFRRPDLATFGSPNVQGPGSYELTDPTVTKAHVVHDEHYHLRRNRTAEDQKHYAQPDSTERLV